MVKIGGIGICLNFIVTPPFLFSNNFIPNYFMQTLKSRTPLLSTISHSKESPIQHSQQTEVELPLSNEVKDIIRRKVSSYLSCHITMTPPPSKQLILPKKNKLPLPKDFPAYTSLMEFMREEKVAFHLYKQKIDRNLDECLYFYLKLLCLSIDYECRISQQEIDEESSVMIEAFLFLASSLFEAGAEKASFYFSVIAVTFCEYYKLLHPIGEFLLIMAKIHRKIFRYKESIILLKKALEYNWWTDVKKIDRVSISFRKWLANNAPEELQTFDERYELARVFPPVDHGFLSQRTHKGDPQLRTMREHFIAFLDSERMLNETFTYQVVHRRPSLTQQRAIDLQLDIYNEMSFNFLQLNKKEESKLFAEKYESGYTEPEDSKIKLLSRQLINSIQKRVSGWHQMNLKNFQLLFFVNVFDIVDQQRSRMRSMDQEVVLDCFKVIFESLTDNFVTKDMFQYEIPLPLELKRELVRPKKRNEGKKFIIRQRSSSNAAKQNVQVLKKYSSDKVQENLIFNYRGLKVSRLKLLDIYTRFVDYVGEKERQGSFRTISWK